MRKLILMGLCIAAMTWAAMIWKQRHDTERWVAEQRASHRGYGFGYRKELHRAYLIWPNGKQDGVSLDELSFVQMLRTSPKNDGDLSDYSIRLVSEDEDLGNSVFCGRSEGSAARVDDRETADRYGACDRPVR
jgi:hypothetical protein